MILGHAGGPECVDQGPDEREAGGRSRRRRCDEGSRSEKRLQDTVLQVLQTDEGP